MRTLCITTLALLAFSLGAVADSGVASAAPTPGKDDAGSAKEHYKRGTTLYDLNRFDEAVKEFEAAYELKDDPVLLYNIAQSYRLANKYPEALRFYRNYLRRYATAYKKDAPNKSEVEQKIEDMEKLISEQNRVATAAPDNTIAPGQKPATTGVQPARPVQPTTPPPVTPPPARPDPTPVAVTRPTTPPPSGDGDSKPAPRVTTPPPTRATPVAATPAPVKPSKSDAPASPGRSKLIAGVVVAVVGLATVGAGVAFGLMAQSAANDQAKAPAFDPALDSKGKQNATLGLVLDAAGGALVAVGVGVAVWGALQKPEKARSSSNNLRFTPALGSQYAGGALSLTF